MQNKVSNKKEINSDEVPKKRKISDNKKEDITNQHKKTEEQIISITPIDLNQVEEDGTTEMDAEQTIRIIDNKEKQIIDNKEKQIIDNKEKIGILTKRKHDNDSDKITIKIPINHLSRFADFFQKINDSG